MTTANVGRRVEVLWAACADGIARQSHWGDRGSRRTLCGRTIPRTGDDGSPLTVECRTCCKARLAQLAHRLQEVTG